MKICEQLNCNYTNTDDLLLILHCYKCMVYIHILCYNYNYYVFMLSRI